MKEHVFDIMFREPYVYQERGLPDQKVKKKYGTIHLLVNLYNIVLITFSFLIIHNNTKRSQCM